MSEILAPVDAEAVVVLDLAAQYQLRAISTEVGTSLPDGPVPESFVKVRLMGGSATFISSRAMLTVECWSRDEVTAWDLASLTVGLVDSLPERLGICSGITNVGEPVNQPDPDTNTPRYVFTKVVHLRKRVVL